MQPNTAKIPNLGDNDNGAQSRPVVDAPAPLTLAPIKTAEPALSKHPAALWAVGTFAALFAAEVHGAALVVRDTYGMRFFPTVHDLSGLVSVLTVFVALVAAPVALIESWRCLERSVFWRFAVTLLPSMFAAQIVAWVAASGWTNLLNQCWDGREGREGFYYSELQAEFFVLLTIVGLVVLISITVGIVAAWYHASSESAAASMPVPNWPMPEKAPPAPLDNVLN